MIDPTAVQTTKMYMCMMVKVHVPVLIIFIVTPLMFQTKTLETSVMMEGVSWIEEKHIGI